MTIEPEKRHTWLGEWVRAESFWKDVASRTFSGVIVVIITGLFAGMIGWAVSDSVRPIFAAAAVGLGLTLAAIAIIVVVSRLWLWSRRTGKDYSTILLLLMIGVTCLTLSALLGPGLELVNTVFELTP